MARANEMAEKKGDAPYLVPYGGSSPTGAAAYTLALEELLKQGYHPDWILLASSSGGTQAGLMAGQRRFGFRGKIMGISIDEPREALSDRVTELATETGDLVGGDPFHIASGEVLVNDDYLGGGYGVVGDAEREAIHLFASMEGMLLDPVYTGRAAAGLIDLIRKKRFNPEETVLFWHTGGTPALFAERYAGIHVRPGGTRVEGPSQG
jgi:1-aminocyclopropane-1-carboxylate deaminase/D-cysteine desulfhydrase-like pyridoxal-dependent ACC family enzyme